MARRPPFWRSGCAGSDRRAKARPFRAGPPPHRRPGSRPARPGRQRGRRGGTHSGPPGTPCARTPGRHRGARLSRRGRQVLFTMSNSKTRRQRPERDPPPLPPHHDGGFPGFNPLPGRPPMRVRPGKAECAIPQVRTRLAGWPAGAVRTRRDRTQAAPPPRSPGRRTRPDARSRLRSYPYPGPRMAPLPPVSFPARFHPAPYLYGTLSTPVRPREAACGETGKQPAVPEGCETARSRFNLNGSCSSRAIPLRRPLRKPRGRPASRRRLPRPSLRYPPAGRPRATPGGAPTSCPRSAPGRGR